ncbi:hypothetical protein [Pedobacter caeni]|uniref:Uncharacterized protein n=1 Tax=Pedobacter caeni TaxID=288992 RepID=A0A1M4T1Q4_9SPHI|nr:hypothetical protein [Pedobacter caeni]SHE38383.1 hypothetical protein SAMN04488522_10151 [Pedobacter caeni]
MAMFKIDQSLSVYGLLIHFVIAMIFTLSFILVIPEYWGAAFGYFAFCVVLFTQQRLHRNSFRVGMMFLKLNHYEAALESFTRSLEYFEEHPVLDKYRWPLLISTSSFTCKEMCLRNITACHVLLKNKEQASFYYDTLLCINADWKLKMPWYDEFLNKFY